MTDRRRRWRPGVVEACTLVGLLVIAGWFEHLRRERANQSSIRRSERERARRLERNREAAREHRAIRESLRERALTSALVTRDDSVTFDGEPVRWEDVSLVTIENVAGRPAMLIWRGPDPTHWPSIVIARETAGLDEGLPALARMLELDLASIRRQLSEAPPLGVVLLMDRQWAHRERAR